MPQTCQHPINKPCKWCIYRFIMFLPEPISVLCLTYLFLRQIANGIWKSEHLAVRNGSLSLYHCLWLKDITPGLPTQSCSAIHHPPRSPEFIHPQLVFDSFMRWDRARRSTYGYGNPHWLPTSHLSSPIPSYTGAFVLGLGDTGTEGQKLDNQESIRMKAIYILYI